MRPTLNTAFQIKTEVRRISKEWRHLRITCQLRPLQNPAELQPAAQHFPSPVRPQLPPTGPAPPPPATSHTCYGTPRRCIHGGFNTLGPSPMGPYSTPDCCGPHGCPQGPSGTFGCTEHTRHAQYRKGTWWPPAGRDVPLLAWHQSRALAPVTSPVTDRAVSTLAARI